ncbi:ABC transporter substrate-binding protein [Halolamina sp. CBA1230]|uniref:ABC transporter substrate-binding protein n=1 Tax=Halolamina sp. CBA1230 TaxID=1853690 RepID=UPI0009A17658|nr:ABC transporter substrate-binding protein [Halolamina sp. CBA1230]QKY19015.1 ABC transporter substrate-binding protein [Halolamina sp. CBA1230]
MVRQRPTRREYLTMGGAVTVSGLLAGCSGGDSTPTGDGSSSETTTGTATAGSDGSYTVSMAPMGAVTFDAVPETVFTRLTHLAGMAFALGKGNDVTAMHAPGYYDALWNQFTPQLPGVKLDWSGRYSSWEPSKEKLYELDSDVHLADPASVAATGWSRDDLEEVATNVGPWFGNQYSDTHATPPDGWADQYEYYDLWTMFEKVAAVFREEARYESLAAIHDDLLGTIEDGLPSSSRRPTVTLAGMTDVEAPYVYKTDQPGILSSHVRPLGARGAFGDDTESGAQVDLEAMLEADPDVILALGGMHPDTDVVAIRENLAEHPVGAELTAVQNDRVYAQGARYQGPILNLFQLEMTAKQIYPEVFGEWPTYESGSYPEIPRDEQLFDREQVASVIVDGADA